jgi:hypothetical protein
LKKIFLAACVIFLCHTAKSQVLISLVFGDKLNSGKVEFGLDGGWNLANIKGLEGGKANPLFNIGFYFDIKTKNPRWMVHTGVIVKSTMGEEGLPVYSLNNAALDTAFIGGKVERRINYFNVPIMMKYKMGKAFYVEGGTMLALRAKAYDVFTQSVQDKEDLTYELEISDQFHRIDAGAIAGIGYRLMGGNGMNIGIRYYIGLVNINKDNSIPSQYNESVYFAVGIPIGAGKAKKEREEKNGVN